jgi:hypothetical protein
MQKGQKQRLIKDSVIFSSLMKNGQDNMKVEIEANKTD